MGIKDLFKVVIKEGSYKDKTIGDLGTKIELEKLSPNMCICVDASYIIYNSILAMSSINTLTDENGNITSHINIIMSKIVNIKCKQIWVFDSPEYNSIKENALKKRAQRRTNAEKSNISQEEKDKITFKLTSKIVDETKELLKYCGIPFIQCSKGIEAEQYCAFLTSPLDPKVIPCCNYVLSGDSDVLMFGGNLIRVVTDHTKTGKEKKTNYIQYNLNDILNFTDLTYDQFVLLAAGLGCDFCEKVDRIGPASALKFAKSSPALTSEQKLAIEYFKKNITNDVNVTDIQKYNKDKEKIIKFLKDRNFNETRIQNFILKLN